MNIEIEVPSKLLRGYRFYGADDYVGSELQCVKGTFYRFESIQESLNSCHSVFSIRAELEQENPYDKNAIRLILETSNGDLFVGYVEKELAKEIANDGVFNSLKFYLVKITIDSSCVEIIYSIMIQNDCKTKFDLYLDEHPEFKKLRFSSPHPSFRTFLEALRYNIPVADIPHNEHSLIGTIEQASENQIEKRAINRKEKKFLECIFDKASDQCKASESDIESIVSMGGSCPPDITIGEAVRFLNILHTFGWKCNRCGRPLWRSYDECPSCGKSFRKISDYVKLFKNIPESDLITDKQEVLVLRTDYATVAKDTAEPTYKMFVFDCPSCKRVYPFSPDLDGKRIQCECGYKFDFVLSLVYESEQTEKIDDNIEKAGTARSVNC